MSNPRTLPTRQVKSDVGRIPEMDLALADLRELNLLSVRHRFDLVQRLRELSDAGTAILQVGTEDVLGGDTVVRRVRYLIAPELASNLTTLRAVERNMA